jgi:phosphoglycolate phosphatase
LCASLGIPPANCALIGDASSDLRMAEAAGVGLTLGYTAGWSTAPPLQHHLPRIGHWRELTVVQRPETAPSAKPGDKLSPPEVGARRDEPLRLHV